MEFTYGVEDYTGRTVSVYLHSRDILTDEIVNEQVRRQDIDSRIQAIAFHQLDGNVPGQRFKAQTSKYKKYPLDASFGQAPELIVSRV